MLGSRSSNGRSSPPNNIGTLARSNSSMSESRKYCLMVGEPPRREVLMKSDEPQIFLKCPRRDSNPGTWLRRPMLYPLSYEGIKGISPFPFTLVNSTKSRLKAIPWAKRGRGGCDRECNSRHCPRVANVPFWSSAFLCRAAKPSVQSTRNRYVFILGVNLRSILEPNQA